MDTSVLGVTLNTTVAAGDTRYTAPFWNTITSTTDDVRFPIPPGNWIVSNLQVAAKASGSGTLTVTVRKNGADQSLAYALTTGTSWTTGADSGNSFNATGGDFITIKLHAASNHVNLFSISFVLKPLKPKIYIATLTQSGTNAPVTSEILENTFDSSTTFQYNGVGEYEIICNSFDDVNKAVFVSSAFQGLVTYEFSGNPPNITIYTKDFSGNPSNNILNYSSILILQY